MTFNLHSLIGYLIGHDEFDLDSQLHWVRSMDVAMQRGGDINQEPRVGADCWSIVLGC